MLQIKAGDAVVTVDPDLGARLTSWRLADLELLAVRGAAPEEHGCYPMAPWAGRLRGNAVPLDGGSRWLPPTYQGWAMHGTVLARAWEVTECSTSQVRLRCELAEPWPWPGHVAVSWSVDARSLSSTLEVHSAGPTFPAVAGWHPWFRRRLGRGGPMRWHLDAVGVLARGADGLPTGARVRPEELSGPFDDAFLVPDGTAVLTWPGALELTARSDTSWVVIFDERPDEVCVEPQSGPPDGLGADATMVEPHGPLRVTTTWTWVRPDPLAAVHDDGRRLD